MGKAVAAIFTGLTVVTSSASLLNTNLLVNPGAETNLNGWTLTGVPSVVSYSYGGGYPVHSTPMIPEPLNGREDYFFTGGSQPLTTISQTIDLSSLKSGAGLYRYIASAWLGGFDSQADHAAVEIEFQDASSTVLTNAVLGPVTRDDRNDITSFIYQESSGAVPQGAATVNFKVIFTRVFTGGPSNDGYADNLSFTIKPLPSINRGTVVIIE